ncbi:MAG TPA: FAD-dependent monooxygenase [Vicinamibacterales bacterium]|nr:FAD-dependent monooxygenase [Vicinamibacterales bacterium]
MRVLISGAGIAGPTLAWWLNRFGMSVTIVEQSPALRTGGYVVDFWGSGFEVAERMGLLPAIVEGGYHVRELRAVGPTGRTIAAMPASAVGAAMGNRFVSVPRSEISAAVFAALGDRVETIFGDAIDAIEQTGADVAVRFAHHPPRRFDLVIGADGLHSRTRALVFGPEDRFERYLGIKVAAFEARGYRPRDELVYVMYSEVGQQAARFALRDDRTMFLFTFADRDPGIPADVRAQQAIVRNRFGRSRWECRRILEALDAGEAWYFDRVSQVEWRPGAGCGRRAAWRSSATRRLPSRSSAARERRSRWRRPACWPASCTAPAAITARRSRATSGSSDRSSRRSSRRPAASPASSRRSPASRCSCGTAPSICSRSPGSRARSPAANSAIRSPSLRIEPYPRAAWRRGRPDRIRDHIAGGGGSSRVRAIESSCWRA